MSNVVLSERGDEVPRGSGWALAIDFGTTYTAAAMAYRGRVDLARIESELRMPSALFWREPVPGASGTLILGAEAENWAAADPACFEPAPKRRIGDDRLRLGTAELGVVDAVGAILSRVAGAAIEQRGGSPPNVVCLTYPVRWGRHQCDQLLQAAACAKLSNTVLVAEPIAAAVHFGRAELEEGEYVAVYDLGGGTFDTAVLRRTANGFEIAGEPGGDEYIGGDYIDDRLYRHVLGQLDAEQRSSLAGSTDRAWRQANRQLRREVRRAKEALSGTAECPIYVPPPVDRPLLVTVGELEELIAEPVGQTVDELERTIHDAGLSADRLAGAYLAGGSSRIPLITRMISARLGIVPKRLDDPKAVVALGAAQVVAQPPFTTGERRRRPIPHPTTSMDPTSLTHEQPAPEDETERIQPRSEPAAIPQPQPQEDREALQAGSQRRTGMLVGGGVGILALAIALIVVIGSGGTSANSVNNTTASGHSSEGYQQATFEHAVEKDFNSSASHFVADGVTAVATLVQCPARVVPHAGAKFTCDVAGPHDMRGTVSVTLNNNEATAYTFDWDVTDSGGNVSDFAVKGFV